MVAILFFLAALALLCAPGVLLWAAIHDETDWMETTTWGTTLGLALAVLLAFYVSYRKLSWFWPVWAVVLITAAACYWLRSRRRPRSHAAGTGSLLAVLLLVAISRFAPALVHGVPPGWDPSFHLILAKKLLLLNRSFDDWKPFADVALNYPLGSHLLIALVGRLTDLPLHRIFSFFIAAVGVVSTAQVYCFARRVFESHNIALFAAIAYGFWAYLGSIGYYAWGGLPNELGMIFLLAALATFAKQEWRHVDAITAGVFLAAVPLAHHHVMLVGGATIAVAMAHRYRSGLSLTKPMATIAMAAMVSAPWLWRLAMKATTLSQTDALHFREPGSTARLAGQAGIVFLAFGVAGVALWLRKREGRAGLPLVILATLLIAYFVCGPAYIAYSSARFGQEYSALTPSRFVTDMAYFLPLFAGYAFHRFAASLKISQRYAILIALLLGLSNLPWWRDVYANNADAGRWSTYRWIEQNTPPNTVVLESDPWASYVTWRRTPYPPLPLSEPLLPENARVVNPNAPVYEVVAPQGNAADGITVWRDASGWRVVTRPQH